MEEPGRSASTIVCLELKRNYGECVRSYEHERAQKLADKRLKESKVPKISKRTCEMVFEFYKMDFSPEQIASVVKVSHESIYRIIYARIRAGRLG